MRDNHITSVIDVLVNESERIRRKPMYDRTDLMLTRFAKALEDGFKKRGSNAQEKQKHLPRIESAIKDIKRAKYKRKKRIKKAKKRITNLFHIEELEQELEELKEDEIKSTNKKSKTLPVSKNQNGLESTYKLPDVSYETIDFFIKFLEFLNQNGIGYFEIFSIEDIKKLITIFFTKNKRNKKYNSHIEQIGLIKKRVNAYKKGGK